MDYSKLIIEPLRENKSAEDFCQKFIHSREYKKYLFGRNIYAQGVMHFVDVDGVIDDYAKEDNYFDKPIIKLEEISRKSLVLVLSGGRPLSAVDRVKKAGYECLDYFSFYKYSRLKLKEASFNENFVEAYSENKDKFQEIYSLLLDDVSKEIFYKLLNFKLSYDIEFLKGFKHLEDKQYFEDILKLQETGEVFVDIGGYDGYTTEEFIKICPSYEKIFFFEPEDKNLSVAIERLKAHSNIVFYKKGLSDKKGELKFNISGSASNISDDGEIIISVDRLDDLIDEKVTFMKFDIEGAESLAISGAREIISKNHPRMAISVYHKINDFWKIPQQIFAIRNDYDIYLRHYTESIYETIMFFIPKK